MKQNFGFLVEFSRTINSFSFLIKLEQTQIRGNMREKL